MNIKPVDSNKNKGKTYSALLSKYNEAMKNGFYGEAELIVYAFLEDRLRSFIYYSDFLDSRNSNNINENAQQLYGSELNINNITDKIKLIQKAIAVCNKKSSELNDFELSIKRAYNSSLKVGELRSKLNKIDKWRKYRNEIAHAMFNKDLKALRAGYKDHVEEGFELARYIDISVSMLKNS